MTMHMTPILLGINIDHVATLRQVRGTVYPDPITAALVAAQAGADGITLHLREDRRHIQNHDLVRLLRLRGEINIPVNLELAITDEMLSIAEYLRPEKICLVPEKRHELTTEGGLEVVEQFNKVSKACERLTTAGCEVSLFIAADRLQIKAAKDAGAAVIELHTGAYAEAKGTAQRFECERIAHAAEYAEKLGLTVNAGHGLHYQNTQLIAIIPQIHELNIGHAIVARALFTGFAAAVREMKTLIVEARTAAEPLLNGRSLSN